jgi:hypothetical protein
VRLGFVLVKQMLYHLSQTCSPLFALVILGDGRLSNYLTGLAFNLDSPDLSLPSSWDHSLSHQCQASIQTFLVHKEPDLQMSYNDQSRNTQFTSMTKKKWARDKDRLFTSSSHVPVAPACHPSYLGGWDWEDHGSRPAWGTVLETPMSKITRAKWTSGVPQVSECLLCKAKPCV